MLLAINNHLYNTQFTTCFNQEACGELCRYCRWNVRYSICNQSQPTLSVEIALGLERGLASAAGGYDGLTVGGVGTVAGGKYALDIGAWRCAQGLDVPLLVHVYLSAELVGVGLVADGEEEAVDGQIVVTLIGFATSCHQVGTLYAVVAIESFGVVLVEDFYLWIFLDAASHDVGSAEVGLAHNHIDLGAEVGQIGCLFAGGVAAAHYSHHLLAVEEAVAGGASRHTHAVVLLLIGQTQVFGTGAGGYDDGVGLYLSAVVDGHDVGTLGQVGCRHHAVADVGTEALGLLAQFHHHLVGIDALRIAGEVFDDGGLGELTTRLQTAILDGLQIGAAGVDGGCIAGGAAADDETFGMFHVVIGLRVFLFPC